MTQIPHTKTAVSYAYTILANGKKVGTLQGFNPSYQRALERVREIQNDPENDTVEIVPGRTDFTISIDRLETYEEAFMEALGYEVSTTLDKITNPLDIVEKITDGSGKSRVVNYLDCWVNSINKTIREGTITVTQSVTLWVTKITASTSS